MSAPADAAGRHLGQTTSSARPAKVSPSLVKAIVDHPCRLLTEPEADAAAGVRFTQQYDLKSTGLCEYVDPSSGSATINVYVQLGTVSRELPPKTFNTFSAEPALGRGVVWVVEKGSAKGSGELWFPLGQSGGQTYSVQVQVTRGGLTEAAAIARDCFSHM